MIKRLIDMFNKKCEGRTILFLNDAKDETLKKAPLYYVCDVNLDKNGDCISVRLVNRFDMKDVTYTIEEMNDTLALRELEVIIVEY